MSKKKRTSRRRHGGYMLEGLRPRKHFRLKRTAMKALHRARKAGKKVSLRKLARNTLYATANSRGRRTSRRKGTRRRTTRNPRYVVVNRKHRKSARRKTRRNTRRRGTQRRGRR